MNPEISIVILAGGRGKRIGGNKPDRLLAGKTLLERAIENAARYSATIAVSGGSGQFRLPDNIRLLIDEADLNGPIAGLAAALTFISDTAATHVMMMPCDTPFLPGNLIERLQAGIGTSTAAIACYNGQMHPACSLWRADAARYLPEYIEQGRRSLIGFAESVGHVAVNWPVGNSDPFFNINTAADLGRAQEILAQKHFEI